MRLIPLLHDLLPYPPTPPIQFAINIPHKGLGERLILAQLITGDARLLLEVHPVTFGAEAEEEVGPVLVHGRSDRRCVVGKEGREFLHV